MKRKARVSKEILFWQFKDQMEIHILGLDHARAVWLGFGFSLS